MSVQSIADRPIRLAITAAADYAFSLPATADVGPMPSLLRADAFLSPLEIDAAVTRALDEDLGRAGDITSIATVPEDTGGRAVVAARQKGVIAGLPLVAAAFRRLSPEIEITPHARDGAAIEPRTKLMTIAGNARVILAAERTALNYLGHLSGTPTD